MGDTWETTHFGNLLTGPTDNPDGDDCDNLCEFQGGTDPFIHNNETDQDGLWDNWEMTYFGDLTHGPDEDPDNDGLDNKWEHDNDTNPIIHNNETDQDGLWDDLGDDPLRRFDTRPHRRPG